MHQDAEVDVVVVGLGLAGASAALEAVEHGATVAVVERFEGGGASAMSGGFVYSGGGTKYQREAGYEDSPDNLFNYLKMLLSPAAVSDETLRRFCDQSVGNLEWLEEHGVPFSSNMWPFRTIFPPRGFHLHFTGSEQFPPYTDVATTAPRGHRPVENDDLPTRAVAGGDDHTGHVIMFHLMDSAERQGVDIRRHARATKLLTDTGKVVGVEYETADLPGRSVRIRSRVGVVLASGGFLANHDMVARSNEAYAEAGALGGDQAGDGSGIRLGESVGGALDYMDEFESWTAVYPPMSLLRGVLVGPSGRRVCNEYLYGATIGRQVMRHHGGRAWLVLDDRVFEAARQEADEQLVGTDSWSKVRFSPEGHITAATVRDLADLIGIEPGALDRTIAAYNRAAAGLEPDVLAKDPSFMQALDTPPYHALTACPPTVAMSVGGLVVDEESGMVLRADNSPVEGLYAAGRDAVSICSTGYNSGLSLADCVFSGRRAARHVTAVRSAAIG